MSRSTHVYAATLLGSPNRVLSLRGGVIELDESAAPHVQATITTDLPDAATLAALDPRSSPPPRVTIAVAATFPWATQNRTFNLTLRDRSINHRDAVVSLTLSSDEALLQDYRPLVDDEGAAASQSSLRSIVAYALNKAIPGATLATGTINPAVWVNYVPNPRARTNLNGWSATGADAPQRVASGASDDGPYVFVGQFQAGAVRITQTIPDQPVTGGTKLRVSVEMRTQADVPFFLEVRTNATTWTQSPALTGRGGQWSTYEAELTLPAGATKLDRIQIYCPGNSAVPFGWDVCKLRVIDADNKRDIDLVVMRAGIDAMSFLAPIVQSFGLRLVCDETRTWTLRNEDYAAAGALTLRHGVNLVEGTDRFSRSDEYWFDGAVVIYEWRDAAGRSRRVVESFALTATPSRVVTINRRDLPYPGPGFAAYAVRRAQGRGRDVSATSVADWSARAEQPVQIVLDAAPTQIGKTSRIRFDLDRDEMTVTTRTTDTPPGATDLLAGTIDALAGTIDNL